MVDLFLFIYMILYRVRPIAFVRFQGRPFVISIVLGVLSSMISAIRASE